MKAFVMFPDLIRQHRKPARLCTEPAELSAPTVQLICKQNTAEWWINCSYSLVFS